MAKNAPIITANITTPRHNILSYRESLRMAMNICFVAVVLTVASPQWSPYTNGDTLSTSTQPDAHTHTTASDWDRAALYTSLGETLTRSLTSIGDGSADDSRLSERTGIADDSLKINSMFVFVLFLREYKSGVNIADDSGRREKGQRVNLNSKKTKEKSIYISWTSVLN